MSKLSKTTVARLRAVSRAILAEPIRYEQQSTSLPKRPNGFKPCGTPACLFGWAVYLFTRQRPNGANEMYLAGAKVLGFGKADTLLDVNAAFHTGCKASRLYHLSQWPNNFRHAMDREPDAMTGVWMTGACIAVARIEHFIATEGRE